MNPQIHPAALADVRRQFRYLQAASAGSVTLLKFIAAVRQAKNQIRDNPGTWSLVPGSRRVRRVQIPDFRMQVFYTIQKDGVPLILEIAGPGLQPRWRGRL